MVPELQIGSVTLSTYAALYAVAAAVALALFRRELGRTGRPPHAWWVLGLAALAAGAVGTKLWYFAEVWREIDLGDPRAYLDPYGSGWYGGFLLGGAGVAVAARALGLPVLASLDAAAPGVAAGQVLGRVGCFLGGCCHGRPSDLPWAVGFRGGVYPASVPVHPTQLYEALVYAAVLAALWRRRGRDGASGVQFGTYLLLASAGRFLVELVRVNPRVVLGLSAQQLVALALAAAGARLVSSPPHAAGARPRPYG